MLLDLRLLVLNSVKSIIYLILKDQDMLNLSLIRKLILAVYITNLNPNSLTKIKFKVVRKMKSDITS